MTRRLPSLLLIAAALLPAAAAAQKPIPRPRLEAGADTNDSRAYLELGNALIHKQPQLAADAYHWAIRLDPWSADSWYARRVALLLADRYLFVDYWQGDRRTIESDKVRGIDSLMTVALGLNPFLYQRLAGVYFDAVIREISSQAATRSGLNAGDIQWEIEQYLRNAPPATRAYRAYTEGRFEESLKLYGQAIKSTRKERSAGLRIERASLFAQLGQSDSAIAEYGVAIEALRDRDKKSVVYFYQSKALLEHSMGVLHQRSGRNDKAREAYGRALQEDLSYAPAHVQMAMLALEQKDTMTAVNELELATQLQANSAMIRHLYGVTLQSVAKHREAEEQLRKAIALEPWFAAPHFALAESLEGLQRPADALAEYRAFLAMSAQRDPRREAAGIRIAKLDTH
jgi:tetratricopeptide (TPR) repeat protein